VYWFDDRLLLTAKVAFYLKESLGTSTELLARFTEAIANSLNQDEEPRPRYLWLSSSPMAGRESVELRIPLARLAKERDLPGVMESQIVDAIGQHRAEKRRLPEITVGRPQRSS
jgi:hypothetical protein